MKVSTKRMLPEVCSIGVFALNAASGKSEVANPDNCVVLCDTCAGFCDAKAISFPDKEETKRFKGTFVARKADATNMPFEDNVFEAVFCFHSLHHMDRPDVAIREMFRVCRPGGVVLIADLHETGRKLYKHEPDSPHLLETVDRIARGLSTAVKVSDTRLDRLFVCRK